MRAVAASAVTSLAYVMIAIVNGPLSATARRARFRSTPTSSMTRAMTGFPSAAGEITAFASHCFFFVMFDAGADRSGIVCNSASGALSGCIRTAVSAVSIGMVFCGAGSGATSTGTGRIDSGRGTGRV